MRRLLATIDSCVSEPGVVECGVFDRRRWEGLNGQSQRD
jgi:hypothetical protein